MSPSEGLQISEGGGDDYGFHGGLKSLLELSSLDSFLFFVFSIS